MPRGMRKAKKEDSDAKEKREPVELVAVSGEPGSAIKVGAIMLKKSNRKETREVAELVRELSSEQVMYLNLRAQGYLSTEICARLGINRADVVFWEEDSALFKSCLLAIKRIEADDAEEFMWDLVRKDPNSGSERAFALRGRKPEYQEGNRSTGINQTAVYITVSGKTLAIDDSMKSAGED